MNTERRLALGAVLSIASMIALHAPNAEACGGMFCDGGPMPMPVDQTGENILFVWQGDTIEAHIQIQYMGEAAEFGWVIPLQSQPTFSVGSEPLFQALLAGTVPTYGFTQTFDDCSLDDDGGAPGGDSASAGATAAGTDGGDESGSDPSGGGPQILLTETVGAFDITVLQGGTGQEVFDWLALNGYQQDEEALPILDEYIAEGHLFGAIKLTGGADVDEIHPIVLRFQGDEPCVPLRLTRIAAVEDMGVRSFFLGDARHVPSNYRHVLVNPLKIDWRAPTNYNDVVTLAVDEDNADGRAFVTEYAGTSSVVSVATVYDPAWDPAAYQALEVTEVGQTLQDQGLLFCDFDFGNGCTFTHPLLEGLLAEFVPLPDGVVSAEYWANQAAFPEVDVSLWDSAAFATGLDLRVVEPAVHASQLLAEHPYLTRMYTTISPAEMTADPEFQENDGLPDVPNLQNGVLRTLCNGDQVFTLPDGREVYLPAGEPWPEFPDEPDGVPGTMPSSQIIEEVPANGAPVRLTDNTEQIDLVLASWNEAHGWRSGSIDTDGDTDTDSAGAGGEDEDGGCGCVVDPTSRDWAWAALAVLAVVGRARRRH